MKKIRSVLLIIMLLVLPLLNFAQPLPYQNGNGSNVGQTPVGAPIDGGLSILLILGAGYGAKKLAFMRKKDNKTSTD
jgi:hypothetical protein